MARTYDNTKRARRAAETAAQIVTATEQLLASERLSDVSLQAIAERAGVTVQTVLRHMGSRAGCFEAARDRIAARVENQRGTTPVGDVDAAIADLVAHYEAEGRLVLNLLAQEETGEALSRAAVAEGRAYHRAWVERCLAPRRSRPDVPLLDALVAATDIYVWKLLRLDLGRSAHEVEATIARLVRSTLEAS